MNSRNVILSLILVLAMLVFTFMKIRFWEPKRRLTFNRNPSRIEYAALALCQMDCHRISANDITTIIKTGEINNQESKIKNKPCPIFFVQGITVKGESIKVSVAQCGRVARILTCIYITKGIECNCSNKNGISLKKYQNIFFGNYSMHVLTTPFTGEIGLFKPNLYLCNLTL